MPYPADYGGVIDVFYKLKTLQQLGINIILHCFIYGRKKSNLLAQICEKVYYYPRKKKWESLPIGLPHIVKSRRHTDLLNNLLKDNYPILFEGLHCCYYLNNPALKDRAKLVRMHNVEWDYYQQLALKENKLLKKKYFEIESKCLKKFELILGKSTGVKLLAISPNDTIYLQAQNYAQVHYVPAFHPNEKISITAGRGDYALYHGNLSVNENQEAALFLVEKVFTNFNYPLVIAGKNPPSTLIKAVQAHPHITLKINPSDEELVHLISNAHINVLPTFQATGIKLKLLNALYQGRFCLVNNYMVNNTGLKTLCHLAETGAEFQAIIKTLRNQLFSQKEIAMREGILEEKFSNRANAEVITHILYEE